MNKNLVVAGVGALAVFAGVLWLARDSAAPGNAAPVAGGKQPDAPSVDAPEQPGQPAPVAPPLSPSDASRRPVPTDPRLAALLGTPDDALVEYVAGPDGRVIQELDKDPSSRSYGKPLRQYTYAGDKLAGVVAYKYLGNQVQVIRAMASYKPDGSVDGYHETTEYTKP
jgi:hypothetical protein